MQYAGILSFKTEPYFWPANYYGMIFFRWLHTAYAALVFVLSFIVLFPIFIICAQNKNWHKTAYTVTHYWGWVYHFVVGIRVIIDNRNEEKWDSPCVFVANHFSFADIPSFSLVTKNGCFVGKQSIAKVPLFGYFFTSLHIALNRVSARDRAQVLKRGLDALDEGKSLIIFPEGGIRTKNPPNQVDYKDGAFRMAIKKGVQLVPISLPTNYQLLPDDGKLLLRGNKLNIVVHEAIDCKGLTESDLPELKERVFNTIQSELTQWEKNNKTA